jgi:hypothetical protein
MIRVVHPGSGCRLSTHAGSRIQGSKMPRIRILITAFAYNESCGSGFVGSVCLLASRIRIRIG